MFRIAGDQPLSVRDLEALTYTKQVLQEALRLFPPVYAIVRDCVRPTDLRGHAARPGHTFLISVNGLHRNPRLWDDPDQFRPERFRPDRAAAIAKHRYLPFGAGKHVCIGRYLALPGMQFALARFAQTFDWTFADPDVRPVARPSLKPSGPFRARLARRS